MNSNGNRKVIIVKRVANSINPPTSIFNIT